MLAYLFFTTLKYMKRKSGNGLRCEDQPTHGRDTLLLGLRPLTLIEKSFAEKSAWLWQNFYHHLTILFI